MQDALRRDCAMLSVFLAASAPGAQATGGRSAEVALAERALAHGETADDDAPRGRWQTRTNRAAHGGSAADRAAAGREPYVILGNRSADAVRQALSAFDAAVAVDKSNIDARLRAGDLFLDKYNAPDAKASFDEVLALKLDPKNARALIGPGQRVSSVRLEARVDRVTFVRAAIFDPSFAEAHAMFPASSGCSSKPRRSTRRRWRRGRRSPLDSESMPCVGRTGCLGDACAAIRRSFSAHERAALKRSTPHPASTSIWTSPRRRCGSDDTVTAFVSRVRRSRSIPRSARAPGACSGTNEMRAGNLGGGERPLAREGVRARPVQPVAQEHARPAGPDEDVPRRLDRGRSSTSWLPGKGSVRAAQKPHLFPLLWKWRSTRSQKRYSLRRRRGRVGGDLLAATQISPVRTPSG